MSKSSPPCWKKSADSSAHTPQPFWLLTPDFLDSHIPQGYQGRSPWLVGTAGNLVAGAECSVLGLTGNKIAGGTGRHQLHRHSGQLHHSFDTLATPFRNGTQ